MPNCPQCGTDLDSDDPAGLCPQCLIQGAFASSLSLVESKTQSIGSESRPLAENDFGRYHIVRPLGEGGMGTVYLAEQREPIRRSVALKVIKLGMDTSQVLARFANERQALAVMDHPNIARILDAGATSKGRPYFVMEYIEGAPITQYCDTHRMTISQRLRLFLWVCRAVHHAHQKGVLHRDIKPSNVLVMEQEDAAVPKVIDFGIAKATDQWALENTLMTQFGQMVGTPEYCSPEQADTVAGQISAATDVYSLGVLLFEMLIGAVPLDSRFQNRAGESVPRVEKETALPVEVTTPSLEAWRSYRESIAAHRGQPTEVISLAKRATEIDPKFAMAFAMLGRAYDALGETELGAEYIGKAYRLRDGVSDPENFFITFNYYRQVPRNLELARQTLETWTRKYPEDVGPHSFFAAFT